MKNYNLKAEILTAANKLDLDFIRFFYVIFCRVYPKGVIRHKIGCFIPAIYNTI
jgi:hypothetical protein